jgi:hypothetical protein
MKSLCCRWVMRSPIDQPLRGTWKCSRNAVVSSRRVAWGSHAQTLLLMLLNPDELEPRPAAQRPGQWVEVVWFFWTAPIVSL